MFQFRNISGDFGGPKHRASSREDGLGVAELFLAMCTQQLRGILNDVDIDIWRVQMSRLGTCLVPALAIAYVFVGVNLTLK
jgi:hypothetical protein